MLADSAGASLRGRSVGRMAGQWRSCAVRRGEAALGIYEGALNWVSQRPTLGQMQSEAARRAFEPSGHGKEAASQGLGGQSARPDRCAPSSVPVVGDHLHRQPGAVGGERRGEMVGPTYLRSRMAFSISAWRRWSASSSRVSPSRSVMKPYSCRWRKGQLGTGRGLTAPDDGRTGAASGIAVEGSVAGFATSAAPSIQ